MIISLNWLKNYIDLKGISTDELVDKLTTSGSEVEEVIDKVKEFENIVVGLVETVEKHPNADKLSLCKVSDGQNSYSVVCGAPNVGEGQKVPFAKIGAIIPNGQFEIKKSKIRGEYSFGMICAEDELGISDDHSGIMVLDQSSEVGKPLAQVLKLDDIILDIAITPNRADSLSHIGLARDLAAIYNKKVLYPGSDLEMTTSSKNQYAEVEIENAIGCPRYSAVVVKDVTIKESPDWLKEKLVNVGLRPINNVVDVTNFILHEIGQPLHAFDLKMLENNKIIVKNNEGNSEFTTLDSKKRSMLPSDLMICDGKKPVAIAGVMGGENSEVTAETNNILIESAYFDPSSIRKTAKHLGLSTDSSYRFERGTDPNGTLKAALRAAELIVETGGGEIVTEVIDVYPEEISQKEVSIRFARLNKILGFEIDKNIVKNILNGLEFNILSSDENSINVSIPTFRHDIEREIDLIEEVIRIYGFDDVPPIDGIKVVLDNKIDQLDFIENVRRFLVSMGLNEVISNSLISDEKTINYDGSIKVKNPQSTEMSRLRTSLIPGMLLNISRNLKVKENRLKFFEIGRIFSKKVKEISSFEDFAENESLAVAVSGKSNSAQWYSKETEFDFYDISGIIDILLESLGIKEKIISTTDLVNNELFEYRIEKKIDNQPFAFGGKISESLKEKFDIDEDVWLFEINMEIITKHAGTKRKFKQLLKFPKVYRDFGFILDKNISYEEIVNIILNSGSKLLKNVNLFDIFESESLGTDKKSLAFQLEYFDENKTLTDEEIDREFWRTIEVVKSKLNAELRG